MSVLEKWESLKNVDLKVEMDVFKEAYAPLSMSYRSKLVELGRKARRNEITSNDLEQLYKLAEDVDSQVSLHSPPFSRISCIHQKKGFLENRISKNRHI